MTCIQHRLSILLIAVIFSPVLWGGGGDSNKQAELAALDASPVPWAGKNRQQAQALFARLKERKIAIQSTFYKMLRLATPTQRSKLVSRCQIFFDNVDTQEISNTCCLTSMIKNKKQICSFLSYGSDSVMRVAKTRALRSLTSLFHHRGFPQPEEDTHAFIEWEVWWQGEGQARTLDRALLRTFSSMFSGKGLPSKKAVDDYLNWEIWWQGEGQARTLDRELLRIFSSMFCGRGLPNKKAVEDYLQWDIWWRGDGEARTLDRELLRTFSSMFHSRRLPNRLGIDEILQWLTWEEQWDRNAVKVMARLYSDVYAGHRSLGLPDINKLKAAEQKLTALLSSEERDQGSDDQILPLIKVVALYLANDGGTRQLHWTDCETWLQEHSRSLTKKDVFRRLLLILQKHGGQSIKSAIALTSGKPAATKRFVLDALGCGESLSAVKYALRAIEPTDWWEYLFYARELHPAPSSEQWATIKGYLEALAPVLPNQKSLRRFLTLIWPFSPADQQRFAQPGALCRLVTLLPSIQIMCDLSKSLTTEELRTLFDTCLTYRASQPNQEGLPILFKALLLAELSLLGHWPILPGVLAHTHDQPEGVVVGMNPTIGLEDSVSLFIQVMAAMLDALWGCEYTIDGQTLTLWPRCVTAPITFPAPSLEWHPDGVQIRHWTQADLHRFYQATECWQGLYREPSDDMLDATAPLAARRNNGRSTDIEQPTEHPMVYLPVAILRGVLNSPVPMNAVAWASADYHKAELPFPFLTLLKERADADNNGLVPESLKTFLSEHNQQSQIGEPRPQSASSLPLATWLERVLKQKVLSEPDIDQLYSYRDSLTTEQVVDILFRMDKSIAQKTVQQWQLLLTKRHCQALRAPLPCLDGSEEVIEAVRDAEDIQGDLFSEP